LASIQRQLNLYGFRCVSRGETKGQFFHPLFVRGKYTSCRSIQRSDKGKTKGNKESHVNIDWRNNTGLKQQSVHCLDEPFSATKGSIVETICAPPKQVEVSVSSLRCDAPAVPNQGILTSNSGHYLDPIFALKDCQSNQVECLDNHCPLDIQNMINDPVYIFDLESIFELETL
jgi:hypothetical protein